MKKLEPWEQALQELGLPEAEESSDEREKREAEFAKALEKTIDRRIRRICLKTVAVLAAAAAVIFLGISPLMNALCPTPEHLRGSGVSLTNYLRTYYETVQPYTEILEMPVEVHRKGFGRYTVQFQCVDPRSGDLVVGESNARLDFAYGNYRITDGPRELRTVLLNRFGTEGDPAEAVEQAAAQLRALPPSAYIYLAVQTKEPVAVAQLRQEDLSVDWVEIDSDSQWKGGLLLQQCTSVSGEDWRQDMDEEQLRRQYLENLELLMAEPRLVADLPFSVPAENGLGGSVLCDGMAVLRETYDAAAAAEGPLMTRRFCISGQRDQILRYLEKTELTGLRTEEVKLM